MSETHVEWGRRVLEWPDDIYPWLPVPEIPGRSRPGIDPPPKLNGYETEWVCRTVTVSEWSTPDEAIMRLAARQEAEGAAGGPHSPSAHNESRAPGI